MAKFSKTNQPKSRGKSKQTLILEAIKERSLLGLDDKSSREDTEKAVFGFMAESAFNPTKDTAAVSSACLTAIMKKGWPDMKPIMPTIEFEMQGDTAAARANEVLKAIAEGIVPADIAKVMVDVIKSSIEIEKITELMERITAIEEALKNAKPE